MSEQESGIIDNEMNNLVHTAIQNTRSVLGKLVDNFYMTRKTDLAFSGTTPDFTASVAAVGIADVNAISLYHATLKEIPLVTPRRFDAIRTLYAASDIGTTKGVATIASTDATPNVLTIYLYSNIAAAPSSVTLSYPRNPKKITVDSDTLDIPENFIPIARDICTLYVIKKLERQASPDVVNALTAQLNPYMAQLGLNLSPNTLVK